MWHCGRGGKLALGFIVAWLGAASASAVTLLPSAPDSRLTWDYTSGVLWNVGGGATPLSYTLTPQILSLRISRGTMRPLAGGMLELRPRISLLLEPIVHGPENYYLGGAVAGELEWRNASGRFAAFWASGGGIGWMNSKGYEIAGAQGQDFNFNWLIHTGVRFRTRDEWIWSLGLYFQHVSNHGLDPVNPGLNALGPTLGISRRF